MRYVITLILVVAASAALAVDLGTTAPTKPVSHIPATPVDPEVVRQGGDTLAEAVPIPLPYVGTGTTAGFVDDYDEVCPYTGSTSPDVVYSMTPEEDALVDIDMLGSSYDTKIYVYDEDLNLVDCNDDFHPDYTSKLTQLPFVGGMLYYLVIDGYGGDSGDYLVTITEYEPCILDCPAGAQLENEPPLVNGYVDEWNGGCNAGGEPPFQTIASDLFCGVTGFYDSGRDTDWFHITIPSDGVLEVTGDAEGPTYMFELGPQDCDQVAVIQSIIIGPCAEATMTITGEPGSLIWFWVGPTTYGEGVVFEYDYVLNLDISGSTAVESHSLSAVKGLFR